MKRSASVLILCLGFPTVVRTLAQVTTHNTQTATHIYSHTAFSGVVTSHFQGNDLKAIVDGLVAHDAVSKGEFETSDQYSIRHAKSEHTPLSGGIARGGTIAFVFPTDHSVRSRAYETPQISIEYDADDMSMTVSTVIAPVNMGSVLDTEDLVPSTVWDKASETVRFGVASNAFGAKARVRYSNANNYGLAFPSHSRIDAEGNVQSPFTPQSITFPLPPAKAKLINQKPSTPTCHLYGTRL
jgi:hypothetical protein